MKLQKNFSGKKKKNCHVLGETSQWCVLSGNRKEERQGCLHYASVIGQATMEYLTTCPQVQKNFADSWHVIAHVAVFDSNAHIPSTVLHRVLRCGSAGQVKLGGSFPLQCRVNIGTYRCLVYCFLCCCSVFWIHSSVQVALPSTFCQFYDLRQVI